MMFKKWHFQQYFSYIGGGTGVHGENNRPAASHWQTLSYNVVSTTPCNKQDLNSHL